MPSYNAEIEFTTDNGDLSGVEAVFDYDCEFFPADSSVGQFRGEWEVTATVSSINFSGLPMTRDQLVTIATTATVDLIEEITAEKIRTEIECGDLVAA